MSDPNEAERARMVEYFTYLDILRDSGVTNMFGAAPYLEEMFNLSPAEARKVLMDWMKSFGDRHPSE